MKDYIEERAMNIANYIIENNATVRQSKVISIFSGIHIFLSSSIFSSTATFSLIYGCFLIIKNVPCSKCTQCGEEYLNGVTLQKIEVIIEKFKTMLTEIAIVDYNKAA